jgi:hypothetical protein
MGQLPIQEMSKGFTVPELIQNRCTAENLIRDNRRIITIQMSVLVFWVVMQIQASRPTPTSSLLNEPQLQSVTFVLDLAAVLSSLSAVSNPLIYETILVNIVTLSLPFPKV